MWGMNDNSAYEIGSAQEYFDFSYPVDSGPHGFDTKAI